MNFQEFDIKGPILAKSLVHTDSRGSFLEWFKAHELGKFQMQELEFSQGNVSKSEYGVLRGIHYSTSPKGQSKWVTCLAGKIIDYVIDLRESSPTFKQHLQFILNGFDGQAIFIPHGFGHAFVSLEDNSIVSYLLSSDYSPRDEHEISPFDAELNIKWPEIELKLSEKDKKADSLQSKIQKQELPNLMSGNMN